MHTAHAIPPQDPAAVVRVPDVIVGPVPLKGRGALAQRAFARGEVVMVGTPVAVLQERTLYTLQVAFDRHVLLDDPAGLANHSCTPNAGVRDNACGGYDFIALQPIRVGEEITWDYETTEYETLGVQVCLCGTAECRGGIRGFKHAPALLSARYGPFIARYLYDAYAEVGHAHQSPGTTAPATTGPSASRFR